ncbi:MAG: ATP-binding protein [Anaerolineae bacterium]|nr:ATP-binding protein [Anaerolineae bacterium]
MVDNTPRNSATPREELLGTLHTEYERVQTQLNELKALIEQTQNEVERLQQKNAMVTNRMHHIESNFDSVPRQDIRVAFTEAMDTRNRLLTMRGNLEKLQSDQEHVKRMEALIGQTLRSIEGLSATSFQSGIQKSGTDLPPGGATIVRVIEAQENERKRLARQMHDGPAQSLTNFILQAEICQRLFDRNPDRAAEELNNLKNVASSTFQKVREFIFDLRPMMLDDLGLIPTIRRYIDSFQEKSSMKTTLHILGEERRLESHREVILFRAIQELLGNARDHAKAAQVTVTLSIDRDQATCTVEDNGRGFDPETIFAEDHEEKQESKALGLKTLRERVELLGGQMVIDSSEGEGTKVSVIIPAGAPPAG